MTTARYQDRMIQLALAWVSPYSFALHIGSRPFAIVMASSIQYLPVTNNGRA